MVVVEVVLLVLVVVGGGSVVGGSVVGGSVVVVGGKSEQGVTTLSQVSSPSRVGAWHEQFGPQFPETRVQECPPHFHLQPTGLHVAVVLTPGPSVVLVDVLV